MSATVAAPWDLPLVEIAAGVRRGERRAVDVVDAFLRRVVAHDHALGCFLHCDPEGALSRAREIDARVARGTDPGPLAGVPLGIKDLIVTRDGPTTAGSRILEGWCAPYDATVCARLRGAGAIPLGKLNLDEFGMGSSGERSAFRPTRNPYDGGRVPGGSSSGSAAAVAARLVAGALGTDTGGSVRQPAAFCGVTGVRPTYGRVSRFGLIAFASSLDQIGPIARSARDCALLLETLAGPDPRDATALVAPVGRYVAACDAGVAGLRIGVPREYLGPELDPAAGAALQVALGQLRRAGATVHEVSLPHTGHGIAAYYLICPAEASSNLARYDGVRYGQRAERARGEGLAAWQARTRRQGFGAEVRRRLVLGTYVLSSGYYARYYERAQRVRTLIRRDFARAWDEVDLLATPTAPTAAFRFGARLTDPVEMYRQDVYTVGASLAGICAAQVPCGATAEGLPLGLQLMAPPLAEERLFRAAGAYQAATDWHRRAPVLVSEA